MTTNLHVIALVGLPMSGKSTLLGAMAAECGVPQFSRALGHRGFAARELSCQFEWRNGGAPCGIRLVTYGGAVWTEAMWKFAMAQATGILLVIDPQPAREALQHAFFEKFRHWLCSAVFDPADCPQLATITKTDLVSPDRLDAVRARFEHMGFGVCCVSGTVGARARETIDRFGGALESRRLNLAKHSLDGESALRLKQWDPFRS